MSAALRSIDCSPAPDALVPAAHVHDLIAANSQLERDLASARARNATLLRELRRAVQAPSIVGQSTVDGVLTLTYSSGKIMRHEPTCTESRDAVEYSYRWVESAAPGTPAAIVAAAIEADDDASDAYAFDGMAVIS